MKPYLLKEYIINNFNNDDVLSYTFVLMGSMSITTIAEKLYSNFTSEQHIISFTILLTIITITGIFIGLDFITGVIASRNTGEEISSYKIAKTTIKYFGLILYSAPAFIILLLMPDVFIVKVLVMGPVLLTLLKEYVSIGENLTKRYGGKKFYIFSLVDKIFDLLENKFFSYIDDKLSQEDLKKKLNGRQG